MAFQPVSIQPNSGGDLITAMSYENVGPSNYVQKRNWRREMDAEVRREGDELFSIEGSANEPYPDGNPSTNDITLIHYAKKANGKTTLIVGTATTLYRYFEYEDGNVYTSDPDFRVYDVGVYEDLSGSWLTIGENFSDTGHRWEAVDVAGITVFNNGSDLPVCYDLSWLEVRPIYELREQGFGKVDNISEFAGCLFCHNVSEITDLPTAMNGVSGGSILAQQVGLNVVTTSGIFTAADEGKYIRWDSGRTAKILTFQTATSVLVDRWQAVSNGTFKVATYYGPYSGLMDRTQYKQVWSDFGDANNWASTIPGSIAAGSKTLALDKSTFSFVVGDELIIEGAGDEGAAMTATIVQKNGGQDISFLLDEAAVTTVTSADVYKSASLSSIAGATELQDDGSTIVRAIELQGRHIILKDSSIFVGRTTGDSAAPFQYEKIYSGPKTIFWPWMLTKVGGLQLLYAGKHDFYTFDLSSLFPKEHPKLSLCKDLFFDNVTSTDLSEQCFMTDNRPASEVWICFPGDTDHIIAYDYRYDTCSTIDAAYTAAATVKKPLSEIPTDPEQDWFVLGTTGKLLKYGKDDLAEPFWTREDGDTYESVLKSGFISFGDEFNEKLLRNYILFFAYPSSDPVTVTMYGARNAHETPTTLFARIIGSPTYKNSLPTHYLRNYFQDKISTSGTNNVKLVRRLFEAASTASRSTVRHE